MLDFPIDLSINETQYLEFVLESNKEVCSLMYSFYNDKNMKNEAIYAYFNTLVSTNDNIKKAYDFWLSKKGIVDGNNWKSCLCFIKISIIMLENHINKIKNNKSHNQI